jgi:hypothetical protein
MFSRRLQDETINRGENPDLSVGSGIDSSDGSFFSTVALE